MSALVITYNHYNHPYLTGESFDGVQKFLSDLSLNKNEAQK